MLDQQTPLFAGFEISTIPHGSRMFYRCAPCGWTATQDSTLASPAPPSRRCKRCNRPATGHALRARLGRSKCDPRCTGATGHDCECSCAGRNHGADYRIGGD